MEFALGFMTAAWLLTLVGGAYALWRFAYQQPVERMARSNAFITDRLNEIRDQLTNTKVKLDEEIEATREALSATNQAVINLDNKMGMINSIARSDEQQAEIERRYRARQSYNAGGFGKSA